MRVGIVAQYLNSRNDIRDFIGTLNERIPVSVFLRKNDLFLKKIIPDIDVREVNSVVPQSIWNNVLRYIFMSFGKIPASRTNYFFVQYGKLKRSNLSRRSRWEMRVSLFLSKYIPSFLSYDTYLKNLHYRESTLVNDIDFFVLFTEIYDDLFFAHLIKTNKPLYVYVYSWDHACKMKTFSHKVSGYLVWNEGIKEDLVKLHAIDSSIIHVLGATQLAYIHEYKKEEKEVDVRDFSFRYIYFGCAFGHADLAPYEVSYIEEVAKVMVSHFPDLKLVVRPYPFLEFWQTYEPLKKYSNIVFDDQYRKTSKDLSIEKANIFDKFSKIKHAELFIHLGTTLGLEAAYFGVPILHLDFDLKQGNYLRQYMHQYHLDKYLILDQYPNVIKKGTALLDTIKHALNEKDKFCAYGEYISNKNKIKSFDELVDRMIELAN